MRLPGTDCVDSEVGPCVFSVDLLKLGVCAMDIGDEGGVSLFPSCHPCTCCASYDVDGRTCCWKMVCLI